MGWTDHPQRLSCLQLDEEKSPRCHRRYRHIDDDEVPTIEPLVGPVEPEVALLFEQPSRERSLLSPQLELFEQFVALRPAALRVGGEQPSEVEPVSQRGR